MIKLEVQLVISNQSGESVPIRLTAKSYSPDLLESLVNDCLIKSLKKLKLEKLEELRPLAPEVSVRLSGAAGEKVRAAMHLDASTLDRLANAGASFDFDPY